MRVNGQISYELEHGEGLAGVISAWSIPYSAWIRQGQVEEVEADGWPTLISLTLKVGELRRELTYPTPDELRIWQDVWRREARHCESELQEQFASDCWDKHWSSTEGRAA